MSRLIASLVLLVFPIGLVGCGGNTRLDERADDNEKTKTSLEDVTTKSKPIEGKLFRTSVELLADMPKDKFPKGGPGGGIERALARKWVGKNLVFRTIEWTATVSEVKPTGNGPFEVVLQTNSEVVHCSRGRGYLFGGPLSLGDQSCQIVMEFTPRVSVGSPNVGEILCYVACTEDEAKKIRNLNEKEVTFRATIKSADVGDEEEQLGKDANIGRALVVMLTMTNPSLNGFLPTYYLGGGGGFPAGSFTKVGDEQLTLRVEPGKATLNRGKNENVAWTCEAMAFFNPGLIRFSGPFTETMESTSGMYVWNYADGNLKLQNDKSDDLDKKRSGLLNGNWRLTR